MGDMAHTTEAKSDQLNADDLIAGAITIKITSVLVKTSAEQPCAVSYEGDRGKPFKPSKSMARIMVSAWGDDSKNYVGKSMTLYRDPEVKWAGMKVGGIRISHMSHLDRTMTVALTETRGVKKLFTVQPLKDAQTISPEQKLVAAKKKADEIISAIAQSESKEGVEQVMLAHADALERLGANYIDEHSRVYDAHDFKIDSFLTKKGE